MKIGFTGTRRGCSDTQFLTLEQLIQSLKDDGEFHHGDCVGADTDFHKLVRKHHPDSIIVCHIPVLKQNDNSLWAKNDGNIIRSPETHFARNRNIVNECDFLIGCPVEQTEQQRGGTWYTLHYATKANRLSCIIWPNGKHLLTF